ncbi:MAG: DUF3592 domain-containing protein [Actinobacteria bacterium]|nr:DUF3592 domain-containing protein [Actinomycetota bacterium]
MGAFAASTVTLVTPLVVVAVVGAALFTRARRPSGPQWSRTKGTVLSATVQVGTSGPSPSESPLVFYAYQVNGQVFRNHRVRVQQRPCNASTVIARYPAGSSVIVYYDPADPSNSALEL